MINPSLKSRKGFRDPALRRLSAWDHVRYRVNAIEETLRLRLFGFFLTLSARARGRRFRCRALEGRSNYNICINSDLSVSCNCYDTRGHGRLGNLEDDDLLAILNGSRAVALKRALSAGRLAIPNCAACSELESVPKAQSTKSVDTRIATLEGVMLEAIGACNLTCIGCTRPERPLTNAQMDIATLSGVAKQLATLNVRDIFFFSLGEPFMSKTIGREVAEIRGHLPDARIVVSTNGVHLDTAEKRAAALRMDKVVISLFGDSTQTAKRYQVGTSYELVLRNMRALVNAAAARERRPLIVWKYVLFNWNDRADQIQRALRDAESVGVDQIRFVFTTRPLFGLSWRFIFSSTFRSMKKASPHERVVEFAPIRS